MISICGNEYTLFRDYDKGKFKFLDFNCKVEYLERRVDLILIEPCRQAMDSALKTNLGLVLVTAVCAGISAAGTFLIGGQKPGKDKKCFIDFVARYMTLSGELPKPHKGTWPDWLYTDVRCGLAHGFTIKNGGVEYEALPYVAIRPSSEPEINPIKLLEDFSQGWKRYLAEVRKDGEPKDLGAKFKGRFDEIFKE